MKMKTIISLLIISFFTTCAYTQGPCSKGEKVGPALQFRADLEANTLKIYTLGGLKPSNHKVDEAFQKKYSVHYYDFGCLAPGNMEFYNAYNLLVFEHLKQQWTKEWEKDIKDNAMGFYNWTQEKITNSICFLVK